MGLTWNQMMVSPPVHRKLRLRSWPLEVVEGILQTEPILTEPLNMATDLRHRQGWRVESVSLGTFGAILPPNNEPNRFNNAC